MIKAIRDGREVYHWPASLKELIKLRRKYGALSKDRRMDEIEYQKAYFDASEAANNWQLCACGSLCQAIPRRGEMESDYSSTPDKYPHAPIDPKLARLGLSFVKLVEREKYKEALELIDKIEVRAAEVLKQLGKRPKKYGKPIKIAAKSYVQG